MDYRRVGVAALGLGAAGSILAIAPSLDSGATLSATDCSWGTAQICAKDVKCYKYVNGVCVDEDTFYAYWAKT